MSTVKLAIKLIIYLAFNFLASCSQTIEKKIITGSELIGGKYNLISHHGYEVNEKTFLGNYQLVFLGFTNCPTYCPLGLYSMTETLKELGEHRKKVIPVFITIDPERDNQERLAEFLPNYDKRIVGLTGSQEQVDVAVNSFRGYYRRINTEHGYTFDHSTVIYLLDKNGAFVNYFSSSIPPKEIAKEITRFIEKD